jgi:hypothetical protein
MHAKAWHSIDLDDGAVRFQWIRHAIADKIHATDIQTDHSRSGFHARSKLGMDLIGNIGGRSPRREVGVIAQNNSFASRGHGFRSQTLGSQLGNRNFVKVNFGQCVRMTFATSRVAIYLLNQMTNAVHAIAYNLGRITPRGRNQLIADHQHAVIITWNITLDQDLIADLRRYGVGCVYLFTAGQVYTHSPALVAVARLDNDRAAYFTSGYPGIFRICYRSACRNRNTGTGQ